MEKSESLIAVLLIIAIVVSVASMVVMNNKAGLLTGRTTGEVNASITSMVDFVLTPVKVDFGVVALSSSHDTLSDAPAPFTIENNGSVIIDFTVNSAAALLDGTAPTYAFKSDCNETGCGTGTGAFANFTPLTPQVLFTSLLNDQDKDLFEVDVLIYVPADASAGGKTDTLTFTAAQA